MDDALKRKITDYAGKAYAAAHHTSTQQTDLKIAESKARLASRGVILSGNTVHEVARLQGEHINTVVQAKADGLLDAYELYGAEIDDAILAAATALRATLLDTISAYPASGLPPGVPAFEHFRPLLETNTGAILNTVACQIEQRRVIPKFRRMDPDRRFEEQAIEEARKSIPEDGRPHPRVGAIVVKNGEIVSKAHRGENPKSHAEYIALEEKLSDDLVAGATVYTTLEPCTARNHPKIPCARRLIERRVARVVIGMLDPNPEIRGMGVQLLNESGIETQLFPGDLRNQIEEMNRDFIRVQKERQAIAAGMDKKIASEIEPKVAEIRNEVANPDIQSRFTFEKTDAILEVTNTGPGADVWAPMKIEGMMRRRPADVFARWTHTESIKTRIAKGQTCRLRIAFFEVDYRTFCGQWIVYSTTENGAAEDRPMYSALLGNTDVQTPDINIFVDVVSDPDNASGIKRHHIVLHTKHAEEI